MDPMMRLVENSSGVADTLAEVMLGSMETAAQRAKLAGQVVRATQQNTALLALMTKLDEQRAGLEGLLADAKGARKKLIQHQLKLLDAQEQTLLREAGMSPEEAEAGESVPTKTLPVGMTMVMVPVGKKVYLREGTKYQKVEDTEATAAITESPDPLYRKRGTEFEQVN